MGCGVAWVITDMNGLWSGIAAFHGYALSYGYWIKSGMTMCGTYMDVYG